MLVFYSCDACPFMKGKEEEWVLGRGDAVGERLGGEEERKISVRMQYMREYIFKKRGKKNDMTILDMTISLYIHIYAYMCVYIYIIYIFM